MLKNIIKAIKTYRINKINRQNINDGEGIIFPLSHEYGLEVIIKVKLRLVKIKRKFLAKKWQYSAVIFFLVIISSGLIWLQKDYTAKGATYGWLQTTWSGGASTTAVAIHTDNQTGWTRFFSKDSQINTDNNEIRLSLTSGSNTETDDASGFSSGTQDNTYSTGTGIALKKNNSVTCSADIQCTSGNCDTDFSSGQYCHATASSCAYYALGDPWERATGYEQCSGHSYFKSCTNSVWGSQQNSPDTANDYCDAGGGAQTGYDLAATCTSSMTGGFTDPACVPCSPYKANTTSTCKTSCSTDTDCWSTHWCSGGACVSKLANGTSCSGDNQCSSSNCDTDFSSGSYCHATASSCAYYALGTPWERANGYEQCSGHSYFKSCANSVWGSQQNSPDTANDYCDAGGGAQTGYDLAATCTSSMTGGFTDPACAPCSPYKANTTSTCKTSCSVDADCWSTHWCSGGSCIDPCNGVGSVVYSSETYPTVGIGTQCWLAKNLNIGTRINGISNQTNNAVIEKYCYDNLDANCTTYGGLYQWNEAMQYVTTNGARGICPTGWHIPTDAEFTALETYLGADAGGKMKQTGTTLWTSPNTGATNSSGFTALPAGNRSTDGSFYNVGTYAYFWSSSISSSSAWYRFLGYSSATVGRFAVDQAFGFSVRCLKN